MIRTLVFKDGMVRLHVGGGIVADSSPGAEYLESLNKAKAPLAAIAEVLGQADLELASGAIASAGADGRGEGEHRRADDRSGAAES